MNSVDPITLQVFSHAVMAVAEEMTSVMVQTAHSPALREAKDCSSALMDAKGRLIAQAADMPMHLGSMAPTLQAILAGPIPVGQWHPGDVVITNEPYLDTSGLGSNHLADFLTYAPIYSGDRLIGFSGTMAHHLDFGGALHGSIGQVHDIYGEGLRVPPVKLVRSSEQDETLFKLILSNSRTPSVFRGDLLAQLAACRTGIRGVTSLVINHGWEGFHTLAQALMNYTDRRMRASIGELRQGTYEGEDWVDDDGAVGGPYRIHVTVEVEPDTVNIDFSSTADQVEASINAPFITTLAACYMTIHATVDPHCPSTDGTYRCIRVNAPPGTLVNPRPPAACLGRIVTCHRIVDVLTKAFSQAAPERVMAGTHGCSHIAGFKLRNPNSETYSVAMDVAAGGTGGRANADGLGGMCNHLQNFEHMPIERLEAIYPVRLESFEFIPDTSGAGHFRGGPGIRRSYRLLADGYINIQSERHCQPPFGLFGGKPGSTTRWILETADQETLLKSKETMQPVRRGDLLTMELAGGGGYGDPHDRPPKAVLADVLNEVISREQARERYGVMVTRDLELDMELTESVRRERQTHSEAHPTDDAPRIMK